MKLFKNTKNFHFFLCFEFQINNFLKKNKFLFFSDVLFSFALLKKEIFFFFFRNNNNNNKKKKSFVTI